MYNIYICTYTDRHGVLPNLHIFCNSETPRMLLCRVWWRDFVPGLDRRVLPGFYRGTNSYKDEFFTGYLHGFYEARSG